MVYRLQSPDPAAPGGESSEELHFYATAGGRRMRLDIPGTGGSLVIDAAARTATVVNPGLRAFMTVPLNPEIAHGLLLDPGTVFKRGAKDEVAGHACTVWALGPGGAGGSACITEDGVVLRRNAAGSSGRASELVALSVDYGPQPASLFAPPEGYQDLSGPKAPAPPPAPTKAAIPPPPPPAPPTPPALPSVALPTPPHQPKTPPASP